ncbi:MAG: hypothetical protein QME62_10415, partial [Armatimonadota bacterium]|nr:hypothetical protein [Armatimonadota bacterium]
MMENNRDHLDDIFKRLCSEFRNVPLIALGQTVYWDEPMKAVVRSLLDQYCPNVKMLAGIHDADYFSKVPASVKSLDSWIILPHNDGTTRDLWVATGEISQLFGSETIPTRNLLTGYGVQVEVAARSNPKGYQAFLDEITEAWGWRGLAHVDGSDEIACCIPLQQALGPLIELLRWGFQGSLEHLSPEYALRSEAVAEKLIADVQDYAKSHPDASLTDMYRDFLPLFYKRLLRKPLQNFETTASTELFRFNTMTADMPRFNLVRMFLDPRTRIPCQEAYDLAIEGSDIYTLDRFPEGAIPFDLVIPEVGRGTICLRDGEVVIDTPEPIRLPLDDSLLTLERFSQLVEKRLGTNNALIGKAVTLVLMIASEFIFVLNEEASAYVWRCEKMASLMKERGVTLPFYPILRVNYHAWDAVGASNVAFRLPEHLADAFGCEEISSDEFARSWRDVVRSQEDLLRRLEAINATDDLLCFLAERLGEPWQKKLSEYREAYSALKELSQRTEPLKKESIRLRDLSHQLKQQAQQLEVKKGEHFRTVIKPLQDKLNELNSQGIFNCEEVEHIKASLNLAKKERAKLEKEIDSLHKEGINARDKHLDIKRVVRSLEKSKEASENRERLKTIEQEAELEKLKLVRNAIL